VYDTEAVLRGTLFDGTTVNSVFELAMTATRCPGENPAWRDTDAEMRRRCVLSIVILMSTPYKKLNMYMEIFSPLFLTAMLQLLHLYAQVGL